VIIMREGFVVVHTWIERNYCAIDIQLWGGFNKLNSARHAILELVGSKKGSWSSFRVVVGGMQGTNTWRDDQQVIGPDTSLACDNSSHHSKPSSDLLFDESAFDITMEESLNLLDGKETVLVVMCGSHSQSCISLEAVEKYDRFTHVIALWTCPKDEEDAPDSKKTDGVRHILLCEKSVLDACKETVDEYGKIGSIIFDPQAPIEDVIEDMDGIFTGSEHIFNGDVKESDFLVPKFLLIAPLFDEWLDEHLLELVEELRVEPVLHTHLVVFGDEISMDFAFVSSGEAKFMQRIRDTAKYTKTRTGVEVEIWSITGNDAPTQTKYNPHFYAVDDYDQGPGLEQFSTQQPLGVQSVFQLKNTLPDKSISTDRLKNALQEIISEWAHPISGLDTSSDVGDGALLVATFLDAHVIVVWDGDEHVDFNIFTNGESFDHDNQIINPFTKEMGGLKIVLKDSHPRGTGRVINFMNEINED